MLEDQVKQDAESLNWTPGASFDNVVRVLFFFSRCERFGLLRVPCFGRWRTNDIGYIIGSSGDHGYPVPHRNYEGVSPTEYLDEIAEGEEIGGYYKLDLTYVAKDPDGNLLARLGNLPNKFISGEYLDDLAENGEPGSAEMEDEPTEAEIVAEQDGESPAL